MLNLKPEFSKFILFQYIALPAVCSIVECIQLGASGIIHCVKNERPFSHLRGHVNLRANNKFKVLLCKIDNPLITIAK